VFEVSTISMHTWSQTVTPLVNHNVDNVRGQNQTKFASSIFGGCWRRESSHTHFCIYPQISKFKGHMMTLVHFDETVIYSMQFCLVISRCNITFSMFWFPQGSVATLTGWDGWCSYLYMWHSFLNLTVETVSKFVDFWRSYRKNKLAPFYDSRCRSDLQFVKIYSGH